MNGNKVLNKNIDIVTLAEDLTKICAILPNVPMQILILDLMELPKEDRINLFLRKYFKNNNVSDVEMDSLHVDMRKIKDVIPQYPVEDIIAELTLVQNKQFRVQHVLKKYYEKEQKVMKRPLDDSKSGSPDKKIKTESTCEIKSNSDDVIVIDDKAEDDHNHDVVIVDVNKTREKSSVLTILRELFPDSTLSELLKICSEYGYVATDIVSDHELTMFINQIMNNKYVDNECSSQTCQDPQPSTSSYEYKLVQNSYDKNNLSQSSSSTTEEYVFDGGEGEVTRNLNNSLNENKDFLENEPEVNDQQNELNEIHTSPKELEHPVDDVNVDKTNDRSIDKKEEIRKQDETDSFDWDNYLNDLNKEIVAEAPVTEIKTENKEFELDDTIVLDNNLDQQSEVIEDNLINNYKANEIIDLVDSDIEEGVVNTPISLLSPGDLTVEVEEKLLNDNDEDMFDDDFDDANIPLNLSMEEPNRVLEERDRFLKVLDRELLEPELILERHNMDAIEENVAGPSLQNNSDFKKTSMYYHLLDMFPDICPDFLTKFCNVKETITVHEKISILLSIEYPKRIKSASPQPQLDPDNQMSLLEDLFPDADPTFLQYHCDKYINDPKKFSEFVTQTLEKKDYPTKEDYLRKQKLSTQEKKYTTEFSVENFLEVIPDPVAYFSNPNRQQTIDKKHPQYYHLFNYKMTFFKNHYNHISIKDISSVLLHHSIVDSANTLDNFPKFMKSKRKIIPLPSCDNIPLLQELAFIKHKTEILEYIKKQEEDRKRAFQLAKESGELQCCECCFDDEVMPADIIHCDNGHKFCKECVRRGAEVEIGQGKLDFPCLQNCDAKFSLQILQMVLNPKVFSRMAQRKQLEEIKAAGIEDLVTCPFCDFATIPAPGDKIFRCMNEECMKESCLLCKEVSHIPLRCEEVEKEQDVKLRTYIEDKMTEALLRKCHKCGMKFIKEGGCNKMTCSCGAMMCYICNQPVLDYKHFNGQGGDQYHLCPLYSDTIQLHADAVKKGAEIAKRELGVKTEELKIDPTEGIDKYYKEIKKRNPHHDIPIHPNIIHIPNHHNYHNHYRHHHHHHHRQHNNH